LPEDIEVPFEYVGEVGTLNPTNRIRGPVPTFTAIAEEDLGRRRIAATTATTITATITIARIYFLCFDHPGDGALGAV